jgi:hypothetical protein
MASDGAKHISFSHKNCEKLFCLTSSNSKTGTWPLATKVRECYVISVLQYLFYRYLHVSPGEQRNHGLIYESDCVRIEIGIKKIIVEGFARDPFVEFLSSTPQSDRNIFSVSEQVFIPAVSH